MPSPRHSHPPRILRLDVTAFRNYAAARIAPDGADWVVLAGPNGAGKTNLMEAVSLLSPGRGLRGARALELARIEPGTKADGVTGHGVTGHGAAAPRTSWAVAAEVDGLDGRVSLGTGAVPDSSRRILRVDGAPVANQAAFSAHLAVIWLTPQMDGLFREGASDRRRFLDRLVFAFDPAHAGRVTRYEKLLRDRARLLREGGGDAGWLDALEAGMAETGVAIAAARRALVDRLNAAADLAETVFPRPDLAVPGTVEGWLATGPALAAETRLAEALAAGRGRDAETGGAGTGPHRSDFAVTHRAKKMPAALGSTGEQKALLIAVILAHARLLAAEQGGPPVLLLDEVAAHLDMSRRASLFAEIAALGGQCWVSGTGFELFGEMPGSTARFAVQDGHAQQAGT